MSDIKATASLDASGVVKGAKQAQDAIGKFGFSMDGVLTKLARQLSATDIAAAAVFAGIAKGQQVMAASIKAYEDQQRAIEKATGVASPYLKAQADITAAIHSNNIVLGESASAWLNWGQKVELSFSNLFTFLSSNQGKLELLAVLQGRSTMGAMLGKAYGTSGANQYANQMALTPWGGASGGGASGAGDDDSGPGGGGANRTRSTFNLPNYDNFGRMGGLRGNLLGPGYGKLGPPMGGYKSGDTSEMPEWMMDQLQKQREAFEESQQLAEEWKNRFSGSINSALLDILTNTASFGDSMKNLWKNILAQILQETVTGPASSAISGVISGALGGRSSPTSTRSQSQATAGQINYLRARGAA